MARLFARLEGYEPEIKPLEDKPVGVHSRYADISLHEEESWTGSPTISVEEGFGRVLRVAHERKAKGPVMTPTRVVPLAIISPVRDEAQFVRNTLDVSKRPVSIA